MRTEINVMLRILSLHKIWRYQAMSEILDIAHEMAHDLFSVGAMDDVTMLKVEELCYGGNGDD